MPLNSENIISTTTENILYMYLLNLKKQLHFNIYHHNLLKILINEKTRTKKNYTKIVLLDPIFLYLSKKSYIKI